MVPKEGLVKETPVNELITEVEPVVEDKFKGKKKVITDAEADKAAMDFGAKLKAYPKVKCVVPINPLNKKITDCTVCLNGYIFQIKRGEKVEVPEPIYEILEEGGFFDGKR